MECPKCDALMEVVRFEEIEVDRCIRCGGLWFDRLEDEDLNRLTGSEAIDSGPAWMASMHDEQEKVFCPVDGALMVRMVDAAQQIWVESCPVCHGRFFDAGEFTDLKDRTLSEVLRRHPRD